MSKHHNGLRPGRRPRHHSGAYYVKVAEKYGLPVRNGKGSHVKVYDSKGESHISIPMHRELANGTECAISKFFKGLGILVVLGAITLALIAI